MEIGDHRSHVALTWEWAGDDLSVAVTGGERPHIGAAALACPGPGGPEVQVLTAPGHKETELARTCARDLCAALGCNVLVRCGIHIDRASPEEIKLLCAHVQVLKERLLSHLL